MKKAFSIFLVVITILSNIYIIKADQRESTKWMETPNFALVVPSWAKILSAPEVGGNSFSVVDEENKLQVSIELDTFDQETISQVREMLDDYTSADTDILKKIFSLRTSSYNAVEQKVKNDIAVSPSLDNLQSNNMKIIATNKEMLFGEESFAIMYNTIADSTENLQEYCRIDFLIPSYKNNGILTISFKVPKENMSYSTMINTLDIFKNLLVANYPRQKSFPEIFFISSNMDQALDGIYSDVNREARHFNYYSNEKLGVSLLLPSFFTPIKESAFFDTVQYHTYKINAHTTFTIEVSEKSPTVSMQNQINKQLFNAGPEVAIKKIDSIETKSGTFISFTYNFKRLGKDLSTFTCFLDSEDKFITYTFETGNPSELEALKALALRVILTTDSYEKSKDTPTFPVLTYESKEFTFSYPTNWKITKDASSHILLVDPDISAFKVHVYSEELLAPLDYSNAAIISKADINSYSKLFKNVFIPYIELKNVTSSSNFEFSNGNVTIRRLTEYLDENERLHQCYIYSISRDNILYSMLIDVNTALIKAEGDISTTIPQMLNQVANSFKLSD